MAKKYAFWNNKGGTGKTSLAFQLINRYAEINPGAKILAIDICPQANLSEMMLGSLDGSGSDILLQRHGLTPRCSIGGYFQLRLPSPFSVPDFNPNDFITRPSQFNRNIPKNLDLICGDPMLELQANAVNTLANNNIPGTNTWLKVMDWVKDLISEIESSYDAIFLDCNPSFSFYTQIALSSTDFIILPVMADDSSRRALLNAFSLVYGLKLPSDIYTQHMFGHRLQEAGRSLPKIHLIVKNRITQYMGPASAYAAVIGKIEDEVEYIMRSSPHLFTFHKISEGMIEVRDFQTTGVVSFAKGQPFYKVKPSKQGLGGKRVQIKSEYLTQCRDNIDEVVDML